MKKLNVLILLAITLLAGVLLGTFLPKNHLLDPPDTFPEWTVETKNLSHLQVIVIGCDPAIYCPSTSEFSSHGGVPVVGYIFKTPEDAKKASENMVRAAHAEYGKISKP